MWNLIPLHYRIIAILIAVGGFSVALVRYHDSIYDRGYNAHVALIDKQRSDAERQARPIITNAERKFDVIRKDNQSKSDVACGVLVDATINRMPKRKD